MKREPFQRRLIRKEGKRKGHLSRKAEGHGEEGIGTNAGGVERGSAGGVEAGPTQGVTDHVEDQDEEEDEGSGDAERSPEELGALNPNYICDQTCHQSQRRCAENSHKRHHRISQSSLCFNLLPPSLKLSLVQKIQDSRFNIRIQLKAPTFKLAISLISSWWAICPFRRKTSVLVNH